MVELIRIVASISRLWLGFEREGPLSFSRTLHNYLFYCAFIIHQRNDKYVDFCCIKSSNRVLMTHS